MNTEAVPQVDAILEQLFVKRPGIFGLRDDDLFNLGELVHPPDTQVALTVATDFSAETLRHTDHTQRHLLFGNGFVHVHGRERVLRSGDHVVLVRFNPVHHGLEIAQISDPLVGFPVHHDRRLDEGVGALTQEVHGVLLEGEFHSCKVAFQEVEAAARDLGGTLEVDPFVHLNEFVVGSWLKGELRLGAVHGMNGVARLVLANRHVGVKDVGNRHAKPVADGHGLVGFRLHLGDLCTEVGHLSKDGFGSGLVAGFLGCTNAPSGLVLGASKLIGLVEQVAPSQVEFDDLVDVVVRQATLRVVGTNDVGVFSEHVHVKHRNHHEMLKLKISPPRKSSPPMKKPRMAPPLSNGKPA